MVWADKGPPSSRPHQMRNPSSNCQVARDFGAEASPVPDRAYVLLMQRDHRVRQMIPRPRRKGLGASRWRNCAANSGKCSGRISRSWSLAGDHTSCLDPPAATNFCPHQSNRNFEESRESRRVGVDTLNSGPMNSRIHPISHRGGCPSWRTIRNLRNAGTGDLERRPVRSLEASGEARFPKS